MRPPRATSRRATAGEAARDRGWAGSRASCVRLGLLVGMHPSDVAREMLEMLPAERALTRDDAVAELRGDAFEGAVVVLRVCEPSIEGGVVSLLGRELARELLCIRLASEYPRMAERAEDVPGMVLLCPSIQVVGNGVADAAPAVRNNEGACVGQGRERHDGHAIRTICAARKTTVTITSTRKRRFPQRSARCCGHWQRLAG